MLTHPWNKINNYLLSLSLKSSKVFIEIKSISKFPGLLIDFQNTVLNCIDIP